MKTLFSGLCLLVVLSVYAQSDSHAPALQQLADQAILDEKYVGLSIGYQIAGEEAVIAAAGMRNRETGLPYEANTENRTASISKTMTAVAVLQLYEKGLLDLDAPLSTYLPDFLRADEISIRQILQHTSGIAHYSERGRETESTVKYPNLEAAAAVFAHRPLAHEPGAGFHYSTYGYVVLGLVIEQVAGMSYEEYMQTHVWLVAGMSQTRVEYEYQHSQDNSQLYTRNRRGKLRLTNANNLTNRIPGGGITSTLPDLLRFGQALMDGTLLSEAGFDLMCTPSEVDYGENNPYGMGLYLYHYKAEAPWGKFMGHSGTQTGVSAQLMLMPEQGICVVVLTNTSRAWQDTIQLSIEGMKAAFRVYSEE
ncbi:MAG: serine hydrolase domain-containing protein [Bacteroidota bacterium]